MVVHISSPYNSHIGTEKLIHGSRVQNDLIETKYGIKAKFATTTNPREK